MGNVCLYRITDRRLSAESTPFQRRFEESLYGDVPIVVPAVFEGTSERIMNLLFVVIRSLAYFVEGVEFGPRAQSLRTLFKNGFNSRSRVNHRDWNVAQLDPIYSSILLRLGALPLSNFCAYLP